MTGRGAIQDFDRRVSKPPVGRNLTPLVQALLIAAVYLLFFFITHEKIPDDATVYWHGWADQDRYRDSILAFARLDFSPGQHWYPLGYPLLAAPLSFLPLWLDLTLLSLGCLYAAYWGFTRVTDRLGIGRLLAVILFLASTVAYPRLGEHWITPWTTTLSAALMWQALGRAIQWQDNPAPRRGFILGLILGAIPVTRPADLAVAAIIAAYVLIGAVTRRRAGALWPIIVGGMLVIAVFLLLHLATYGWALSDYMRLSSEYGLNFRQLGWKVYLILVEPKPWFPDGHGLLRACPWLIVGAAGMIVALLPGQALRPMMALLVAVATVYTAITLCYVDLLPSGLWRYGNVHYFKWLFPLFALFAVQFCRSIRRRSVACAAALLGLLLLSAIRLVPSAAGPDDPARVLLFPTVKSEFSHVYMAHSIIRDKSGTLRNFYEYHQVPGSHYLVAIALRRDFAGGPQLWGNAEERAHWPAASTGHHSRAPLPGNFPLSAIARYVARPELGWPCWTPFHECGMDFVLPTAGHRSDSSP